MFTIATTRFTNKTWTEKEEWCKKNEWKGCIYGTPRKITDKIPHNSILFVLEMNNDKNRIESIGLIKNSLYADKYYKIYSDGNYNRYVYKSLYKIDEIPKWIKNNKHMDFVKFFRELFISKFIIT